MPSQNMVSVGPNKKNPTTDGTSTREGSIREIGNFSSTISGLSPNTTYYYKAYVTSSAGTEYAKEESFITEASLPAVTTSPIESVTQTSAQGGGTVTDDGGAWVTARGICWSTSQNPTITNDQIPAGEGMGSFTSTLTDLSPNTTYFVKAYARNIVGIRYGNEVSFETPDNAKPVAEFSSDKTTVTEGESVTFSDESTNAPTSWEWDFGDGGSSTQQNPAHTYTSVGTFTVTLTVANSFGNNSEAKTNYITVNVAGTAPVAEFSSDKTIITEGESVTFSDESTNAPTSWEWDFGDGGSSTQQNPTHTYTSVGTFTVTLTVTNSFGNNSEAKTNYITVNVAGTAPVAEFTSDKTTITEGESVTFSDESTNVPTSWEWDFGDGGSSTQQNPTHTYTSVGTFTVTLTVTNSFGNNSEAKTNYITVNVAGTAPVAEFTSDKTTITEGESVTFSDESTNVPTSWEWDFGDGGSSTQQNPTHTYNSAGTFTVTLTATNSFGNDIESKTGYITVIEGTVGIVTDIEGNDYNTVKIGNQWWMAENLKATRYNDNMAIPLVMNGSTWSNLNTPGYCWYNNDQDTSNTYGALYNWYAVNTNKLCPSGWHIPSDAEWKQLEMSVGMSQESVDNTGQRGDLGGDLKETGLTHWDSPNFRATDIHGFSARAAGLRKHDGTFNGQRKFGDFWTATADVSETAWVHGMAYDDDYIWRAAYTQVYGFPVRCVKD